MMAVVLENITTSTVLARTTVSAVYRTAQLISPVPNISYYKKAGSFLVQDASSFKSLKGQFYTSILTLEYYICSLGLS